MDTEEKMRKINSTKLYFQEFHHKCLGWHITIMGFFIAGVIAVGTPSSDGKIMTGWVLIIVSVIVSGVFTTLVLHYSARIKVLGEFLDGTRDLEDKWYETAGKVLFSFEGVGTLLFIVLMMVLEVAVALLVTIKYLC